ncbi:MAG: hypothetical protein IKE60_21330 [Reyranella sp.]|uniref:hypothetical protein n=1 Tax=Reyranella sp. TaxID=1929291 RepID=UPI0025D140F1|nr:hypothetical protein [Reyranella sp.]MBR2817215.1 hypothetical protein [Reyranella sp.]
MTASIFVRSPDALRSAGFLALASAPSSFEAGARAFFFFLRRNAAHAKGLTNGRDPMDLTPAALLAEAAAECRAFEADCCFNPVAARAATRDMLRDKARELGFVEATIEAAIDTALGATGARH